MEEAGLTRRNTRAALTEITHRHDDLQDIQFEFPFIPRPLENPNTPLTPRHALTPNTRDNTPTNMSSSAFLSPTPSPDEQVIQQRGRKRMPVTWSPDIDQRKQSPFQPINRTPPKSPLALFNSTKNGIVLRPSPKKRLLLNDLEKANSPKKNELINFSTPTKQRNQSPTKGSPAPKRVRMDIKLCQADSKIPLEVLLKGMSHEQLIDIIKGTTQKHPEVEQEIRNDLPLPDIKPLEERLVYLKRNIFRSLPTSRLTSKTDSPAYNRAATHVLAFKKCLIDQGRTLVESQHWQSVLDYAVLSWTYVRATPLWDNHPHNAIRKQCFKYLAGLMMSALKKGHFDKSVLKDVFEIMEGMIVDSDDIQSCLKWIDVQIRN